MLLRIIYLLVALASLNSCTSTIIQYELYTSYKPEWMLNYDWSRNYLGLQYGDNRKERYVFNQINIMIENNSTAGNRNHEMRLLINPEIEFEYLNIIELSFIKDDEKIYLFKDIKIKNKGYLYKPLPEIKYKDFFKYFKNMEIGDKADITLFLIYNFDNKNIIIEELPYKLSCFEIEFNPFEGLSF